MKIAKAMAVSTTLAAVVVGGARAQTVDRSREAALLALESDWSPANARLFAFDGCPQEDSIGRDIFDVVRGAQVRGYDLVGLASAVMLGTYPDCGYTPLNDWLVDVVRVLRADGDYGPLWEYAIRIGDFAWGTPFETTHLVHSELREALLDAAEDEAIPEETRNKLADVAIRRRPEDRQIDEVIAVLTLDIPKRTKSRWIHDLGRRYGSAFYVPLAAAAVDFTDAQLLTVSSAIAADVMNGQVAPAEGGLEALRAIVAERPSLPVWAQIPYERAEPIR